MTTEQQTACEHHSRLDVAARSGQRRWMQVEGDETMLPIGYQVGSWVVEATVDQRQMLAWRRI